MRRITVRVAIAASLIAFGWAVGKAQGVQPDFELIVHAPSGEITLECKRGCGLTFAEQQNGRPAKVSGGPVQSALTFGCFRQERCPSVTVAGWAGK
jgi:hypothetical protein